MAVASDTRPGVPVPVLDLNNSAAIADFVLQVAMSIHQFQAATPDASS